MSIAGYEISPFSFVYANPYAFWLFLFVPLVILLFILNEKKGTHQMMYSSTSHFRKNIFSKFLPQLRYIIFATKLISLSLVILALARPQAPQDAESYQKKYKEGIDIVLAIDVSGSMLARDLEPDRLQASKKVAMEFIDERPNDRIGLVVFEGQSFTQSPITTDHQLLKEIFSEVTTGMVEGGTAIGMGLATSINRLRESDAKSKVVILLTDGVNNRGDIDPNTAGQIAKEMGIRVYSIGVGTDAPTAPMPVQTPLGTRIQNVPVKIDEEVLKNISETTGGKYFRATNNNSLRSIYNEIDQMEKSKVSVVEFKQKPPEKFHGFLLLSLMLIIPAFFIEKIWLKSISI